MCYQYFDINSEAVRYPITVKTTNPLDFLTITKRQHLKNLQLAKTAENNKRVKE
jgi:hypothetical protein